ncbi:MAG: carbon-nitrogen hydrolase family protein [Chloroflexota bacterium]
MSRQLKIAAVRMDAKPALVNERLERAESRVAEAASTGAQLIVLPELFNTGYEYHDNNYTLPEPEDGPTVTWMKAQASQHNAHIAGSLLLVDGKNIYNSQILVAPDGRLWRYDKNYPWLFERAYFKDGQDITVADTDLGRIGMMVCWDYSHPELWQRYAGKVDLMVVTSSPPRYTQFTVIMPDGSRVDSRSLGPLVNKGYYGSDEPFGADFDEQVKWMGVPAVNTTGGGEFRSYFPLARTTMLFYTLTRPDLWRHVRRASDAEIVTGYYAQTKIVDAQGEVLARVADEEGCVAAEVEIAEQQPVPIMDEQPDIPFAASSYFFIDVFGPAQVEKYYRRGVRQQWGQRMAPHKRSYRWPIIIGLGVLSLLAALLRFLGHLTAGKQES